MLVLVFVLLFQLPAVQERYGWRVDFAQAYLRGVVDPVKPLPSPQVPQSANGAAPAAAFVLPTPAPLQILTERAEPTATNPATVVPTLTPTAIRSAWICRHLIGKSRM